jgi:hypothetical protein
MLVAGGAFTLVHPNAKIGDGSSALHTGSVAQWSPLHRQWSVLPGFAPRSPPPRSCEFRGVSSLNDLFNSVSTRARCTGLPASGLPGVVHSFASGNTTLYVGGALKMVQHRDAAPDSGQSTPDIHGLAAFDSLTVKNSRRPYSSFLLHPCLTCRIL